MSQPISDPLRELLATDAVATITTYNADETLNISCVWVKAEGDDIVFASMPRNRKIINLANDPRVYVQVISPGKNNWGLQEYATIEGEARIATGGAPKLLQELAHTYIGPDAVFPAMNNPPDGYVVYIAIKEVGGMGAWAS